MQESLARTASNRTVAKAWLLMLALLQCVWFHVTAVVGGQEVAMALVCGLVAGVMLGKPNPDLPPAMRKIASPRAAARHAGRQRRLIRRTCTPISLSPCPASGWPFRTEGVCDDVRIHGHALPAPAWPPR